MRIRERRLPRLPINTIPKNPIGRNKANAPKLLSGCSRGAFSAAIAASLIVSVEVTEFAPGVTDAGLRPQVGDDDAPATTHESCTGLPRPAVFRLTVMVLVACPPDCTLSVVGLAVIVNAIATKLAVAC